MLDSFSQQHGLLEVDWTWLHFFIWAYPETAQKWYQKIIYSVSKSEKICLFFVGWGWQQALGRLSLIHLS